MAESVPVRCPACRRKHVYAAPSYPCACGELVTPVLDRDAVPEPVTHHTWDEGWVRARCEACGRADQWPRPELACPCGVVLRMPVLEAGSDDRHPQPPGAGAGTCAGTCAGSDDGARAPGPENTAGTRSTDEPRSSGASPGEDLDAAREGTGHPAPKPRAHRLPAAIPLPRPAFQPVVIRTARDAVTAAALYLRWLGYRDIRRADQRPPSGIGLAARGIVAQVDPTVRPASLRDVECLWLAAMTESTGCVYFSLAGYEEDARTCADSLGIPLFVLDLTGTPQPVNSLADELVATGA